MSKSTWNHLSHADRWSWLRPKYLGQWYTIVQTFWPFGYDIFKIPKCQNQLYFWFKIARVACLVSCITWWYMIPNARRKFEAFLKFPEGFGHWGRSILVNGILYFRLFGHLEMTSSKYQNVKINFDSGSNLRRALGNMYHHVIHDSKRSAQVWWLMEDFPGVLSHPGRHTGPRKKKHFLFWIQKPGKHV